MNKELLQEMIEEARREVSFRFAVYSKRVQAGKMTQEEADKRIKLMSLIQKSLQKIYDGAVSKEVQMSLFDVKEYEPDNTMKNFMNHQ